MHGIWTDFVAKQSFDEAEKQPDRIHSHYPSSSVDLNILWSWVSASLYTWIKQYLNWRTKYYVFLLFQIRLSPIIFLLHSLLSCAFFLSLLSTSASYSLHISISYTTSSQLHSLFSTLHTFSGFLSVMFHVTSCSLTSTFLVLLPLLHSMMPPHAFCSI
jgi:hypothetical protein